MITSLGRGPIDSCQNLRGQYSVHGENLPGFHPYSSYGDDSITLDRIMALDLSLYERKQVVEVQFDPDDEFTFAFLSGQGLVSKKKLLLPEDIVSCAEGVATVIRKREIRGEDTTTSFEVTNMLSTTEEGSLSVQTVIASRSHWLFLSWSNPSKEYGVKFRRIW